MSGNPPDPAIKTDQFDHQKSVYEEHWNDSPGYCLFWEMGLGKSKEMCDVASRLFLEGIIDAVLYVAPKSVFVNFFTQELPVHMGAPYCGIVYKTSGSGGAIARIQRKMILEPSNFPGKLRVVCASYNSLAVTDRGFEFAEQFVKTYRTLMILDESTAIQATKSRTAQRMKQLGAHCVRRWIATGTPVASSPHAVHSQIEFVDPQFWPDRGMRSKEAFKRRFGKFSRKRDLATGRSYMRLDAYTHLDVLNRMITPVSSRLLKEDSSVKLPPKLYRTVGYALHPSQKAAYDAVRKAIQAELEEGIEIDAKMAMVRVLRLQQIACGHVTAIKTGTAATAPTPLLEQALLRGEDGSYDQMARDVLADSLLADSKTGDLWAEAMEGDDFDVGVDLARHRATETLAAVEGSDQAEMFPREQVVRDAARSISVQARTTVDIVPRDENPRLKVLVELLEEAGIQTGPEADPRAGHKVIVWCRFVRDVQLIAETLTFLGIGHRCYQGSTKQDAREEALNSFRDPESDVRVLVANLHAISQGVTLTIAKTAIYYSCTTSLEKRLQSEDRAHRIGQDRNVLIVDIVANGTADQRLIDGLRKKFDIAARVTGDQLREWISSSPSDEEDD